MSYSAHKATNDEIESAVLAVVSVMPAPRGMDGTMLANGYLSALQGFPASAIQDAVQGFLSGRFAPDFSTKFCPTPPDLAAMVRKTMQAAPVVRNASGQAEASRKYAFRAPASRCIERGIHRDEARRLVRERMYPAGSIWLPGGYDDRPEFGDLYEPDDNWAQRRRIKTVQEVQEDEALPKPPSMGMTKDERRAAVNFVGDLFWQTPPHERGGFFARDHSAAIRRWLTDQRAGLHERAA